MFAQIDFISILGRSSKKWVNFALAFTGARIYLLQVERFRYIWRFAQGAGTKSENSGSQRQTVGSR